MRGVTVGKLVSTATLLEREKSRVTVLFLYALSSLWVGVCVKLIRMSGLAGNLELVLLCFQSFKFSKSLWWDSVAQWITVRKSDRTLVPMFSPFLAGIQGFLFPGSSRGDVLFLTLLFSSCGCYNGEGPSTPFLWLAKKVGGWRGRQFVCLFVYLCWLLAFVVVCHLHSKISRPNNILAKVDQMEPKKLCLGTAHYSLL